MSLLCVFCHKVKCFFLFFFVSMRFLLIWYQTILKFVIMLYCYTAILRKVNVRMKTTLLKNKICICLSKVRSLFFSCCRKLLSVKSVYLKVSSFIRMLIFLVCILSHFDMSVNLLDDSRVFYLHLFKTSRWRIA